MYPCKTATRATSTRRENPRAEPASAMNRRARLQSVSRLFHLHKTYVSTTILHGQCLFNEVTLRIKVTERQTSEVCAVSSD
jgi:hypothetical protein